MFLKINFKIICIIENVTKDNGDTTGLEPATLPLFGTPLIN